LRRLTQYVWLQEVIPEDWKRGIIILIWTGKSPKMACGNYRGITLLSVPEKVFIHTLLGRVKALLTDRRRPQQSGFTPGMSTTDSILGHNVISQMRREFQKPLWVAYIDFKAAFDSIDRESLWLLLSRLGMLAKIIRLVKLLYQDTSGCVCIGSTQCDFFASSPALDRAASSGRISSCPQWTGFSIALLAGA
jgi:hypothetical protein